METGWFPSQQACRVISRLESAGPAPLGCWGPENRRLLSAAVSCPPSLVYTHCESGCPRQCEGNSSSCADRPSEGCFCPPHQVMLEGSCVPEEACSQCVGDDGTRHQVGAPRLPRGLLLPGSVREALIHGWPLPTLAAGLGYSRYP